eukprot:364059-Chlamydomonas_euryale.AAC.3
MAALVAAITVAPSAGGRQPSAVRPGRLPVIFAAAQPPGDQPAGSGRGVGARLALGARVLRAGAAEKRAPAPHLPVLRHDSRGRPAQQPGLAARVPIEAIEASASMGATKRVCIPFSALPRACEAPESNGTGASYFCAHTPRRVTYEGH